MSGYFRYEITGPLELYAMRAKASPRVLTFRVLFCSPELERTLPFSQHPRLRVTGELNDVALEVAWQPSGARGHYIMVSPTVCKTLGLRIGDEITFRFNVAPQDRVVLPEELSAALDAGKGHRAGWAKLTPGRQRGWAHHIGSARTTATRAKRVAQLLSALQSGTAADFGSKRGRT